MIIKATRVPEDGIRNNNDHDGGSVNGDDLNGRYNGEVEREPTAAADTVRHFGPRGPA